MNQYLLSILKEVNTIIIPGIGALTVTNAATGEIMFMSYLKYDDGKLAEHIAQKEGIELNDAKILLAKYVREIETRLNTGDTYDMYQFGSFSKNNEGEIEFNAWNNEAEQTKTVDFLTNEVEPDSTSNTAIEENEIIQEIVTEPTETITINETEAPLENEIIQEVDITSEVPVIEPEKPIDNSTATSEFVSEEIVPPVVEQIPEPQKSAPLYTEEQQWNDDLDLPPINAKIERPKKPIIEKIAKDKKPKSPLKSVLLILLFLIIGGGTAAIFMRDQLGLTIPFLSSSAKPTKNVKSAIDEDTSIQKTSTETTIETTTETVEETNTESQEVEEEKSTTITTQESNMIQTSTGQVDRNKPYHIIGAAFSDLSNAERYQKKLNDSGNASIVLGKFDQLYIVSISSYSTQEEAIGALSQSKEISQNAWIFRFP